MSRFGNGCCEVRRFGENWYEFIPTPALTRRLARPAASICCRNPKRQPAPTDPNTEAPRDRRSREGRRGGLAPEGGGFKSSGGTFETILWAGGVRGASWLTTCFINPFVDLFNRHGRGKASATSEKPYRFSTFRVSGRPLSPLLGQMPQWASGKTPRKLMACLACAAPGRSHSRRMARPLKPMNIPAVLNVHWYEVRDEHFFME